MRISVWQQFSSNHSAGFVVVGTFESEDKARIAAAELETILQRIDSWWENLSREDRLAWGKRAETTDLTPPEAELSDEYKVDWPFSINWYHWEWDRSEGPVKLFHNFVIVSNPHPYIYKGPQPFDELLKRFGAEIALGVSESQSYPDTLLYAELDCIAPSESVPQAIADSADRYIKGEGINPWLVYHSGTRDPRSDEMQRIQEQALQEDPIEERLHRDYPELRVKIADARFKRDEAEVARLQNQYIELLKEGLGGKQPIDWQENEWVHDAFLSASLDPDLMEYQNVLKTQVQRNGTHIHFSGLRFINWRTIDWVGGLRAIYAWLSDAGCTDIRFTFSQMKDTRWEQP